MNQYQKKRVLERLEGGKPLSSIQAAKEMDITRLAAVVKELRKMGYPIISIRRERRDNDGKLVSWWVEYRLTA